MEYLYTRNVFGTIKWVFETYEKPFSYSCDRIVYDLMVVFTKYDINELHAEGVFVSHLVELLQDSAVFKVWSKDYKNDPTNINTRYVFRGVLDELVKCAIEDTQDKD